MGWTGHSIRRFEPCWQIGIRATSRMLRVLPLGIGRGRATLLGSVESGSVKIFSIARTCAVLGGLWISIGGALAAAPPLFVLNSLEASVSVIDPVTWTETARIPTGKEPHHLYPVSYTHLTLPTKA